MHTITLLSLIFGPRPIREIAMKQFVAIYGGVFIPISRQGGKRNLGLVEVVQIGWGIGDGKALYHLVTLRSY
jgi:hypothetical protein